MFATFCRMNCTPELVFICKLFDTHILFPMELEGYVIEGKFHLESVCLNLIVGCSYMYAGF